MGSLVCKSGTGAVIYTHPMPDRDSRRPTASSARWAALLCAAGAAALGLAVALDRPRQGVPAQTAPEIEAGASPAPEGAAGGRTASAVFGRVVDARSLPLAGVTVKVGGSPQLRPVATGRTDGSGAFEITGAPAGVFGLHVAQDGFLHEYQSGVHVVEGQRTGPIEVVLRTAPTLSGTVQGPGGAPIQGARVVAMPLATEIGSGATSRADGTFRISLPADGAFGLEATHPDFETWGDAFDGAFAFDPGSTGIEIRMERAHKTRFVVVDDATGAPLETFGLRVYFDEGSKGNQEWYTSRVRPKLHEYEDGIRVTRAREGLDRVRYWARGYELSELDVAHDEERPGTQTLRLRRETSMTPEAAQARSTPR